MWPPVGLHYSASPRVGQCYVGNGLCAVPGAELTWLSRLVRPERHGGRTMQRRSWIDYCSKHVRVGPHSSLATVVLSGPRHL